MQGLDILLGKVPIEGEPKDFSSLHPRHMEDHLRSLASRDPKEARRLSIHYLSQVYSKFLSEDKVDGSTFDNQVLNALEELLKKA